MYSQYHANTTACHSAATTSASLAIDAKFPSTLEAVGIAIPIKRHACVSQLEAWAEHGADRCAILEFHTGMLSI